MDTITTIADLMTLNGSAPAVMVKLTEKDKRLIASAPELLAAAKAMWARLAELGDLDPNHDEVREWQAAIATAEGRT